MNRKEPFLRASNLRKTYAGGRRSLDVLRGVSMELGKGSITAVLGPSGAGKTTLLYLLSGMDHPTQGEVWVEGRNLTQLKGKDRARFVNETIGFVFQSYHLLSDLTALENVMLPAQIWSKTRKSALRKKAIKLLGEIGLGDRIRHYPSELSGGEQQRVAIVRSVMNDPKVVFCDEPTGNLDSVTGQAVCDYLRKLSTRHHKTVLIVTHDDKIAQIAERVFHLKDGQWLDKVLRTAVKA